MNTITVTFAGTLIHEKDGQHWMKLVGWAVRRDGIELARFASRPEAEARAAEVARFLDGIQLIGSAS